MIQIKTTHGGKIQRANKFDSGFDVFCLGYRSVLENNILSDEEWFDENKSLNDIVNLKPNETIMLLTGIQIHLPEPIETKEGYFALEIQARPRSGLSLKQNTNVKFGTIDNPYQGVIGIIFKNESDKTFIINKNDKIAQLVFNEVFIPKGSYIEQVENFNKSTSRGENGFGSSGKK